MKGDTLDRPHNPDLPLFRAPRSPASPPLTGADHERLGKFVKQLGRYFLADRENLGEFAARDVEWLDEKDNHGRHLARVRDRKGGDPAEWPSDLRIREFPGGAK